MTLTEPMYTDASSPYFAYDFNIEAAPLDTLTVNGSVRHVIDFFELAKYFFVE